MTNSTQTFRIVRNSDDKTLWTFTRPGTAKREAEQHLDMLRPGFARIVPSECRCGDSLDLHIGGKPCVYGKNDAKNLRDLPVYKWAVNELRDLDR